MTEEALVCRCTHLTLFAGFLEAFLKTLECSNRPDQVFTMLADLPRAAWAPANVLWRIWLPLALLVLAGVSSWRSAKRDVALDTAAAIGAELQSSMGEGSNKSNF